MTAPSAERFCLVRWQTVAEKDPVFFDLDPSEQVWYMTPSWRGPSGVDGGPALCVELDRAPRERIPPTVSLRLAAPPQVLLFGGVFAAGGRIVGFEPFVCLSDRDGSF